MDVVLTKLLTNDKQARIYIIDSSTLVNEVNPFKEKVASEVFCATLTFTCILHGLLTNAKRITVKLEMSEPTNYFAFGADLCGDVQGFANEDFDETKHDSFKSMIGENGFLKIIQDNGNDAIFTGIVDITEDDLVGNLSRYFLVSDQTQSVFRYYQGESMSSSIQLSRGVLVQTLPFADDSFLSVWEKRLESAKDMLMKPCDSVETLTAKLFPDAAVAETWPVRLKCSCDRQTVLDMLMTLDTSDIEWTVKDTSVIEVKCGKCGKSYAITVNERRSLKKE